MDKTERLDTHKKVVSPNQVINPSAHLNNPRDSFHYYTTMGAVIKYGAQSLLDIGCWDGWLPFLIAQNKKLDVDAIDICDTLIQLATDYKQHNNFSNVNFRCGWFDEMVFDRKYDIVYSYETLEHIAIEDVPLYYDKMLALANKAVIISLPDADHKLEPQHLWTPTFDNIGRLFIRSGYDYQLTYQRHTNIPSNFVFEIRM